MAVLAVAHELGGHWRLAASRAAERADDAIVAAAVDVDVLPGKRRAPAVRAAVAVGLEGSETLIPMLDFLIDGAADTVR